MSYHVTNPELEARLQAQKRNATIASLIIGLLLMSLLALIFWAIGITVFTKKTEPMVAFNSNEPVEDTIEKVKVTPQVTKTPTAASSSSAVKVITASAAVSSFSVPTPDVAVESMSLEFGASEGFGQGWGGAGSGFASGGAGAFSFMGSKMSGDKVCFVIDYSKSMQSLGRIELLKEELLKTIETLGDGMQFQLIFFAGPVWTKGSTIKNPEQKGGGWVVVTDGKEMTWTKEMSRPSSNTRYKPVEWEVMTKSVRESFIDTVENTPLCFGTNWDPPLTMALDMKPSPDLIVFLTDGLSGSASETIAVERGKEAKQKGIKINTIALMEPKARKDMSTLAELTGGEFALIDKDGKKVNQGVQKK